MAAGAPIAPIITHGLTFWYFLTTGRHAALPSNLSRLWSDLPGAGQFLQRATTQGDPMGLFEALDGEEGPWAVFPGWIAAAESLTESDADTLARIWLVLVTRMDLRPDPAGFYKAIRQLTNLGNISAQTASELLNATIGTETGGINFDETAADFGTFSTAMKLGWPPTGGGHPRVADINAVSPATVLGQRLQ